MTRKKEVGGEHVAPHRLAPLLPGPRKVSAKFEGQCFGVARPGESFVEVDLLFPECATKEEARPVGGVLECITCQGTECDRVLGERVECGELVRVRFLLAE